MDNPHILWATSFCVQPPSLFFFSFIRAELSCSNSCLLPLVLQLGTSDESVGLYTLPLGPPSPLEAGQTQFSLPLLTGSLLQPPDHLGILDLLPHVNVCLPCISEPLEKSRFPNWKQYPSCSITSTKWWGIITNLNQLATLLLILPDMLLATFAIPPLLSTKYPSDFSTEPLSSLPACCRAYGIPGAGLCASQGSHQPRNQSRTAAPQNRFHSRQIVCLKTTRPGTKYISEIIPKRQNG